MALFVKRPLSESQAQPLYTVASKKSWLIVGVGNPGPKFEGTRHNIGAASLDFLATQLETGAYRHRPELQCNLAEGRLGSSRLLLCQPTTFMNLSGQAVAAVSHYYRLAADSLIVIHDELDLPFGQIRGRIGGGSAGHHGLDSVMAAIGPDFGRLRIGVGAANRQPYEAADYVLASFTSDEQAQLPKLYREVAAYLTEAISSGRLQEDTRSFLG